MNFTNDMPTDNKIHLTNILRKLTISLRYKNCKNQKIEKNNTIFGCKITKIERPKQIKKAPLQLPEERPSQKPISI